MLRFPDILVRIRILGSVPLETDPDADPRGPKTNGSGSGSLAETIVLFSVFILPSSMALSLMNLEYARHRDPRLLGRQRIDPGLFFLTSCLLQNGAVTPGPQDSLSSPATPYQMIPAFYDTNGALRIGSSQQAGLAIKTHTKKHT
jgi:hypothetical protein